MNPSTQTSFARLEEIVGAAHVLSSGDQLAARAVDDVQPAAVVQPATVAEVSEIVRYAGSEKLALIPCGGGSKLGIGSPPERYDIALDLSRMNHVLAYDPHDLTLGVEPGVRIVDLARVLAEQRQFLPLTVPFAARATIGGIVAANSSSPLRHSYGGVRDFCLGIEFVTGDGTIAKAGGRVVKNVTGFDLHKLLIGSLGTLAVITRVNFRTFPLPPMHSTFVMTFADGAAAFGFCQALSESVLTPQIVEVADPAASELLFAVEGSATSDLHQWCVMVTAAGQPSVVARYESELGRIAEESHSTSLPPMQEDPASSLLSRISEFPRLALEATPSALIFRISVMPAAMAALIAELREIAARNQLTLATLTRVSGIVYAVLAPGEQLSHEILANAASQVFAACANQAAGASAMLEWCPAAVKRAIGGVWGTPRQDFELMRRIKNVFDPQRVLSPGRFAGGN